MAIAAIGVAIMVIGYVGVFFGKLIKAAVSRQREFLADASAVQFTRNPLGIGGALKKIGGLSAGSRVTNTHAEEASHFFFANSLSGSFMNLFATHPPLEERIQRIDPSFNGAFDKNVARPTESPAKEEIAGVSGFASGEPIEIVPEQVVETVGTTTPEHLTYAAGLLASLPEKLVDATHEPFGARAVIYCLLLNKEKGARKLQLDRLAKHADQAVNNETAKITSLVEGLEFGARLPVIDMAIPALKSLTIDQYRSFRENVDHLVNADKEVDLFEYTLQRMIVRHLEPVFTATKPRAIQYYDIKGVLSSCVDLLSTLACWGADDVSDAEKAFAGGSAKLNAGVDLTMASQDACGLSLLDEALSQLAMCSPMIKKRVLNACATCVAVDGKITIEESELLRAIADSLGCPMPPLLQGTKAA
jgi:hypothetical protein